MRIMPWIFKGTLLNEPYSRCFDKVISLFIVYFSVLWLTYLNNLSAQYSQLYFFTQNETGITEFPNKLFKTEIF